MTLDSPVDLGFGYALETYLIYPWIRHEDVLIRPLRVGPHDAQLVVARISQLTESRLRVDVTSETGCDDASLEELRESIVRCLQLDYPMEALHAAALSDPVVSAALSHRGVGRGKLYPDLFEALCGVICAQRTRFARVYSMMRNISIRFGEPLPAPDSSDHAFPKPCTLARAEEDDLRQCGLGFRAPAIIRAAQFLTDADYSWNDWRTMEPSGVSSMLLGIKGVGPYTANLAANLTYGRSITPHVDSYVAKIIGTLYLHDPDASLEAVGDFVIDTWGPLAECILDLLTTDTEVWSAELGVQIGVVSGARRE